MEPGRLGDHQAAGDIPTALIRYAFKPVGWAEARTRPTQYRTVDRAEAHHSLCKMGFGARPRDHNAVRGASTHPTELRLHAEQARCIAAENRDFLRVG